MTEVTHSNNTCYIKKSQSFYGNIHKNAHVRHFTSAGVNGYTCKLLFILILLFLECVLR